jgi:undecaprenyl-diphosphatase
MQSHKKKIWPTAMLISTEMLASLVMFSGAFVGLVFLIRPGMRKHKKLDLAIMDRIGPPVNEKNTHLMRRITFFGTHRFFIPANLWLIAYFMLVRRKSWYSIRIASVALSSLAIMFLLKTIFNRTRPDNPLHQALGKSFPSGHALMSLTFYGLLVYIIHKSVHNVPLRWTLTVPLVGFVQLIGLSRIYLRNHYPSDIVAGNVTGLLWLIISLRLMDKIEANLPPEMSRAVSAGAGSSPPIVV